MATTVCPIGTKNHQEHDDRISFLEDFKKNVDRTSRIMALRVMKLERALVTLNKKYEESRKLNERLMG